MIVEQIETTKVIETEIIDDDPIIVDVAGQEIVTVEDPEAVIEIQAPKKTPVKVHLDHQEDGQGLQEVEEDLI